MNKTEQVKTLVNHGDFKSALRIAKNFRINVTEAQRTMMTGAYECMVHPRFYKSIGIDVSKAVEDGIAVLTEILR